MPSQALLNRSITILQALKPGSVVAVTSGAGATTVVEYTTASTTDVQNGVATWFNWPKGSVAASTTVSDMTATAMSMRLSVTGGAASVDINDFPMGAAVEPFLQDWASGYNTNLLLSIAGALPATLTNPAIQGTNSVDNYTQISLQNKSATVNGSADLIAYPDNVSASDLTGFMDMGITSSTFAQAAYAVTGQNEGYLFASAPNGSGKTGSMVIATDSTGTRNDIRFYTNGFGAVTNLRLTIKKEGQTTLAPMAADPANPSKGDIYFNNVANKLKVYTGAAWETVTSA